MTGRANRLLSGGQDGGSRTNCPTDVDGYCEWLNQRERRRGRWIVVSMDGVRSVDWREEAASAEWLRDRNLTPKIGARAA